MRGIDPLIAMRLRGKKPACGVFIHTDAKDADLPKAVEKFYRKQGGIRNAIDVHIGPADNVRTLDLRSLVGLTVHVQGMAMARVRQVAEACQAAGARRVLGSVFIPKGEETQTIAVVDGFGGVLWQA